MRVLTRNAAVVLILFAVPGCREPAAPASTGDATTGVTSDTAGGQSAPSSPTPLSGLAAALGVGGGPPLPEGFVPGGDCPPPPPDAAQEIAAQEQSMVPLKAGLTLAYAWTRTPTEEHECLLQVTKVDAAGIDTTMSCDSVGLAGPGPHLRRVCRADLRSAGILHTVYGAVKVIGASGEEEPEIITGATAFSLSVDQFAQLKRTGTMTHRYVELGPSGQLAKDGIGELRVEGRETIPVLVNDRVVDVPVVKARGALKWWLRGERVETEDTAVILDDERFPLLIDHGSSDETRASRIRFAKITYPNRAHKGSGMGGGGPLPGGGNGLEGGLLENKRVDVYGIYFDFNSDRIRKESEPVLQEIGDIMRRHPDWRLSIDGHTDNIGGNTEYNLALSRRRSEAVRMALVNRFAISTDRLVSGGHGASAPKDTNDTPEGRARNRRVELVRQ